jgi:hypothetical protein
MRIPALAIAILAAAGPTAAKEKDPFSDFKSYDRTDWDRTPTECDRLAGHPNDPERVGDGVAEGKIDIPAALAACAAAVKKDSANPRLNYQLARLYGYSGRHEEGDVYRDRALRAGYPQSLFVVGYIRVEDWDGRGKDACYGGELIRRSAVAGRYAGLVGFPHYAMNGLFDECPSYPRVDRSEMKAFLDRAELEAGDFYQRLLVKELKLRLGE